MHPREYAKRRADPRQSDGGGVSAPIVIEAPTRRAQSPRAPPLDDDVLLTATQTRARVGDVTTMCIWRWMRDPRVQFPAPVKINSRNYWRLGDLRQWQE